MKYHNFDLLVCGSESKQSLVGGVNPLKKYARQNGFILPNFRGENKNIFETTI